jgi:hypothetical protein
VDLVGDGLDVGWRILCPCLEASVERASLLGKIAKHLELALTERSQV